QSYLLARISSRYVAPPYVHPFPTRRSSDLVAGTDPIQTTTPSIQEWKESLFSKDPINFSTKIIPEYEGPIYEGQLIDRSNNQPRSESTRLNSSHVSISYAVFCLKKKNKQEK